MCTERDTLSDFGKSLFFLRSVKSEYDKMNESFKKALILHYLIMPVSAIINVIFAKIAILITLITIEYVM